MKAYIGDVEVEHVFHQLRFFKDSKVQSYQPITSWVEYHKLLELYNKNFYNDDYEDDLASKLEDLLYESCAKDELEDFIKDVIEEMGSNLKFRLKEWLNKNK